MYFSNLMLLALSLSNYLFQCSSIDIPRLHMYMWSALSAGEKTTNKHAGSSNKQWQQQPAIVFANTHIIHTHIFDTCSAA